ncbi:MAG: hypothetical protein GY708_29215 [Actinomycetia bacterium]|nr:hypothetical protein [Actinomycetes bacterium]
MRTLLDQEAPGIFNRLESASQEERRRAIVVACSAVANSLSGLQPEIRRLVQSLVDRGGLSQQDLDIAHSLAQKADDEYFDLQERGKDELALQRFSEARLLTAITTDLTSASLASSAEAVYELCMVFDDPSIVVASLVEAIRS